MPQATLHVTVPEGVWVGDLTRDEEGTRFRVLSVLPSNGSGVVLAEVESDALETILEQVRATDAVVTLHVLRQGERTALIEFETMAAPLLAAARDAGVPLETPFEVSDGKATWEVTAPNDRLSALGDRLREAGIPFEVEAVRRWVDAERLLTERQATLLETAVEHGYYDTPRECTLSELAEELDLAKSTCSETLHRAEGKVIKQFIDEDGSDN